MLKLSLSLELEPNSVKYGDLKILDFYLIFYVGVSKVSWIQTRASKNLGGNWLSEIKYWLSVIETGLTTFNNFEISGVNIPYISASMTSYTNSGNVFVKSSWYINLFNEIYKIKKYDTLNIWCKNYYFFKSWL